MKFAIDLIFSLAFCVSLSALGNQFSQYVLKLKTNFYTSFFIGCGLSIIILFVGGLLGLFNVVFLAVIVICVFLFLIVSKRFLPSLIFGFEKKAIVPLILTGLLFLLAGLAALSPPIKNDTLYYHLGLPKLWIDSGGISFYPTIAFSATALNNELLLTPIVALISPEAAQFFVFLTALFVVLLLAHELNRFVNTPAYYGIIFIAALPLFVSGLSDAKNDYLAAGFCLVSLFYYFDYFKIKSAKHLILSGVFAGLAASTKSNALIFLLVLTVLVIVCKPRLKEFAYYLIGAAILGLPWYTKAFIETGNPFYPFYNNLFQSACWPNVFDNFNRATMPASVDRGVFDFILSPFKLVYWPDLFRGRIGPLPLIFLPLMFVVRNHPKIIKRALILCGLFFVIWYGIWANCRYLLPAVLILTFVSAYIAYRAAAKIKSVRIVILIAVSLLIAVNVAQTLRDNTTRIKAAVGLIERDTFLTQVSVLDPNHPESGAKQVALPYIDIWQHANRELPKNAVVGILCSNWTRADGFYLDRRFLYINPTEQKVIDFSLDSLKLVLSIKNSGMDYFLIDNDVIAEFNPESRFVSAPGFMQIADNIRRVGQFIKENGRLEFQTGRYQLYRIN
jgi:4-amino-4-deoxy-L-arabinose transferase-like glycosyltransferase